MTDDKQRIRLILAEYLKKARLEAGLSQGDVSKQLKLKNAQFISNIERGVCSVPMGTLKQFLKLYKISQNDLVKKYTEMHEAMLRFELEKRAQFQA